MLCGWPETAEAAEDGAPEAPEQACARPPQPAHLDMDLTLLTCSVDGEPVPRGAVTSARSPGGPRPTATAPAGSSRRWWRSPTTSRARASAPCTPTPPPGRAWSRWSRAPAPPAGDRCGGRGRSAGAARAGRRRRAAAAPLPQVVLRPPRRGVRAVARDGARAGRRAVDPERITVLPPAGRDGGGPVS